MKQKLAALARPDRDGDGHEVLAPAVGRYTSPPPVGTYLEPGSYAGMLAVLRKSYRLVVPRGVRGIVGEVMVTHLVEKVEYGQPLLRLGRGLAPVAAGEEARQSGSAEAADVAEGAISVRSPTDGIFYRRPSPDQPPYVEEGAEVVRGRVLGLVEVMKCFNQITYGADPSAPERAVVTRVLVDDSGEVKNDQVLFLLEPVA